MKNKCFLIMISIVLIGCTAKEDSIIINQGLNLEEMKSKNKKSLNFNKKNNYSNIEVSKESNSNKNDLHKGCTAPCCAE